MNSLPTTTTEAYEHGAITRSNGYCKHFNPFRNTDDTLLYREWLKGWSAQHLVM